MAVTCVVPEGTVVWPSVLSPQVTRVPSVLRAMLKA